MYFAMKMRYENMQNYLLLYSKCVLLLNTWLYVSCNATAFVTLKMYIKNSIILYTVYTYFCIKTP